MYDLYHDETSNMYSNSRQSKTSGTVLKWIIFSTVFTLGFMTFLNTRDSFWLKPLSAKISFANWTAEATFQTEEVEEAREKTNLDSDDFHPTPKVALLFLVKGPLPHESLWRAFFEAASKLSLRHPPPDLNYLNSISGKNREKYNLINKITERKLLQNDNKPNSTACGREKELLESEIERLLKVADDPSSVIANQSLFSVYTHPKVTFHFPSTSIFYQTEVKDRVDTGGSWGKFKLLEAELRLMKVALKDTSNKKLILLSESCIPLYPPELIYSQLMSEQKSRMNSCGPKQNTDVYRFSSKMEWKYFSKNNWRKSSQWFALNRAHADVLVKETYFKNLFRRHCNGVQGWRFCVADEHYIASALDAYGLGYQTDCTGMLTYSEFHGGIHPTTFKPASITPSFLREMQNREECSVDTARTTAAALLDGVPKPGSCNFQNLSTFNISNETDVSRYWVVKRGYKPLKYRCALFARKFPEVAIPQTLLASLSCKGGSLGYWC